MTDLFRHTLLASVYGGIVVLAILFLRLILKRSSRRMLCILWFLAAARLLFPFQIQSTISLQPELTSVAHRLQEEQVRESAAVDHTAAANTPDIAGLPSVPFTEVPTDAPFPTGIRFIDVASWIWLVICFGMLIYSALSFVRLRRRVRHGVILSDGVWYCGHMDSAFVLGFFRPQIYIPASLSEVEKHHVIAHERCHIQRLDHWWKLLGFIVLSIHWFNPLVWVAYVALCRDLEMACDETVVRDYDLEERKAYSSALLSCSVHHHSIAACPVAFGEVSVKARIKNVLHYKKPGFWIILAFLILIPVVTICLFTIPNKSENRPTAAINMTNSEVLSAFYHSMDELKAKEDIHLVLSYNIESECDYFISQKQEVWVSDKNWYQACRYDTAEGTLTTCYAQINGIQYACEYSDNIPNFVNREWSLLPEKNYTTVPVLSTDWKNLEVIDIRQETGEDNGAYTIVLKSNYTGGVHDTYYENLWYIRLDAGGNILSMANHTYGDLELSYYSYNYGKVEGNYETRNICTVLFLPSDPSTAQQLLSEVPSAS